MKNYNKIVFFHLYNDYSGSPKVLKQVIDVALKNKQEVDLFTSDTDGFLSNLPQVNYTKSSYKLSKNKLIILFRLLFSQLSLIKQLKVYKNKDVTFYINTILPFGAALAGKLYNIKVVYHIHETSITPQIWKKFLLFVVKKCAYKVIYVSDFLKTAEPIKTVKTKTIYNPTPTDFEGKARNENISNVVLMACSLKKYKGVFQFIELAKEMPTFTFKLVLNATEHEISKFLKNTYLPPNLITYPKQADMHSFYQSAFVVLNLSIPSQWVETFGLTIVEAMAYGVPTIVPNVGGPTEIVTNDVDGFTISSENIAEIAAQIKTLFNNRKMYARLSVEALNTSSRFSYQVFEKEIQGELSIA